MATVQEYIVTKLERFNISLNEIELDSLLIENDLNGNQSFEAANYLATKKAIASIIPELLLVSEVSEGDYTIKWDKSGIRAYYSMLCKELGIEDVLNGTATEPQVVNGTELW